jgi:hypothetical protein
MTLRAVSAKTQVFIDLLPGSTLMFPGLKYDIPKATLARRGMQLIVTRRKQNKITIVTKVC